MDAFFLFIFQTHRSSFHFLCRSLLLLLSLQLILREILRRLRDSSVSGRRHGPPSYPILGCLISFYQNRYRLLDWYTQLLSHSPTLTIVVRRIGARRTIVTANPDNVEHVLKTNFGNFPKGKPFTEILGDFLGNGIFNADGDVWYHQRKLASHEFTAKCLRQYVANALQEEVDKNLLPLLEKAARDEKMIDLQDLLRRLAFDVVCRSSLGFDPGCLDPTLPPYDNSTFAKAFDAASEISARRGAAPISAIWKLKRLLEVGPERRLKEATAEIHSFVTRIIRERRRKIQLHAAEGGNKDFLSKMIVAGKHEEAEMRDMVISFIMAGRDTTSAAMTWLFYLLSRHPQVERQILKELKIAATVDPKNTRSVLADYETLQELAFLKACLCESMRLYPPVAWDSKHALADDRLPDGTRVLAGDRVTYFPYGMGRMEKLWGKDVLEFRPDRWLVERSSDAGIDDASGLMTVKNESPYKFPVFQAGPRVCLGKEVAFLQMKYVVASVLERFEIKPAFSNEPVFVPLLTAHMAGGLKVFVRRRSDGDRQESPTRRHSGN